jgi:Tfp pilus assembly protein PilO
MTFILSTVQLILCALILVVYTGAVVMGYRYMLKRDPAKLEKWAQQANELAARLKEKLQ